MLPHPEGYSRNEFAAKAVLETLEDFSAAVADDFVQPDTAVNADKQSAFVNPRRAGMGGDRRVYEMAPDLEDFRFGLTPLDAQAREHSRHHVGHRMGGAIAHSFCGDPLPSTPLGQGSLARRGLGSKHPGR